MFTECVVQVLTKTPSTNRATSKEHLRKSMSIRFIERATWTPNHKVVVGKSFFIHQHPEPLTLNGWNMLESPDYAIFSKHIPKLHDFSFFSTVSIAANSCLELLSHASLLLAPPGRASPADPKGPAKSRSKNLPMGYHRGILKGLSWDYHGDIL